jgi:hypothetical protein
MKRRPRPVDIRFIEITLTIYRLHVVVTWETTLRDVAAFAKRHSVLLSEGWRSDFTRIATDGTCNGFCMSLGDDNCDLLVWLRRRPRRSRDYGTLYHELFHAVQAIIKSRNLGAEIESPAFLYEYLATQCNRVLWQRR